MDALISKLKEEFGTSEFTTMQALKVLYPGLASRDKIINRRGYIFRQLQSWEKYGAVAKRKINYLPDNCRVLWRIKL